MGVWDMKRVDGILESLNEQRLYQDIQEEDIIDEEEFIKAGALEEGFTKDGAPVKKNKKGIMYTIQKWIGMVGGKKETKYTQKEVGKDLNVLHSMRKELEHEAKHREMRRAMREQT